MALHPVELKPASAYLSRKYSNLQRMTFAPAAGCLSYNYRLSESGARVIEANPAILLHNRLYNRFDGVPFLYEVGGRPVCVIESSESDGAWLTEDVVIVTPEEVSPDAAEMPRVQLASAYPAHFLPFDLHSLRATVEEELRGAAPGYKSSAYPSAIYQSSDPLAVYLTMHYLTQSSPELRPKLTAIKQVTEVGSALGLVSFIFSQFLTDAKISGAEIDPRLVIMASRIKRFLGKRLGYRLANVDFSKRDILAQGEDYFNGLDALVGWFPLGHDIKDVTLLQLFQKIRTGALVFQFFGERPLPVEGCEQHGFRRIPVSAPVMIPCNVFERI